MLYWNCSFCTAVSCLHPSLVYPLSICAEPALFDPYLRQWIIPLKWTSKYLWFICLKPYISLWKIMPRFTELTCDLYSSPPRLERLARSKSKASFPASNSVTEFYLRNTEMCKLSRALLTILCVYISSLKQWEYYLENHKNETSWFGYREDCSI